MSVESLEKFTIPELKRQLHAARHAFHVAVIVRLEESVAPVSKGLASEMYLQEMKNYDGIIENAASGDTYDANQREMDKGFG